MIFMITLWPRNPSTIVYLIKFGSYDIDVGRKDTEANSSKIQTVGPYLGIRGCERKHIIKFAWHDKHETKAERRRS
jgi:hypothetical protein